MELYYDVEAHGEMHHNPAKNVLWIARDAADIAKTLALDESSVTSDDCPREEARCWLRASRGPLRTSTRRCTLAWNAMFVSAYLDAARVLGRIAGRQLPHVRAENAGPHVARSLERIARLRPSHRRTGAGRIARRSSLRRPRAARCVRSDARFTLLRRGEAHAWTSRSSATATPKAAASSIVRPTPRPMGGLDVRRKPFQDSPTPGANSVAAIALIRMHAFTGDARYHAFAQKDTGSVRRNRAAVRTVRGDLRTGRDALRASPDASGRHWPR